MTESAEQLPLPFVPSERYVAPDFVASPSNQAAITWLGQPDWPDRRLALWGAPGCGKTHLLHIWVQRNRGVLLSGPGIHDLLCLPEIGAVAVDDADQIVNQELMLHLLNVARDRNLSLLLAARSAPSRWYVSLADLSSRLRAISAVEIEPPDDDLLRALLVSAFAQRQLDVSLSGQAWLLRNLPRTASDILMAVRQLDMQSLREGRKITRSFAIEMLGRAFANEGSMLPAEAGLQTSPDRPNGG